MKIAVYPGTFDPPTNGHANIALRASEVFDHVIIAIGNNIQKNTLFSVEERIQLWKQIFPNNPKFTIASFDGLIVDFAKQNSASAIVRGLRVISDFEYELQLAETNRSLDPSIDTVFFTAQGSQLFVSSTVVKEIAYHGGDITEKAPEPVCKALYKKFQ